jgi:hypothetical protein
MIPLITLCLISTPTDCRVERALVTTPATPIACFKAGYEAVPDLLRRWPGWAFSGRIACGRDEDAPEHSPEANQMSKSSTVAPKD